MMAWEIFIVYWNDAIYMFDFLKYEFFKPKKQWRENFMKDFVPYFVIFVTF